jgi:hypothetical protein
MDETYNKHLEIKRLLGKGIIKCLKTSAIALIIAGTALFSPSIQAATISLDNGILNSTVSASINGGSSFFTVPAGVWIGTVNGIGSQFFCYDINQDITVPGNYNVTAVLANNPSLPSFMAAIPATTTPKIEVAAALLQSQLSTVLGNNVNAAGMQLAIWSVLYNPTIPTNITMGSVFQASGSDALNILQAANTYLADASLNQNPTLSQYSSIPFFLQSDGSQIVGGVQAVVGVSAPEPKTYMVLGGFLLLIGFYYCRKAQSAAL